MLYQWFIYFKYIRSPWSAEFRIHGLYPLERGKILYKKTYTGYHIKLDLVMRLQSGRSGEHETYFYYSQFDSRSVSTC